LGCGSSIALNSFSLYETTEGRKTSYLVSRVCYGALSLAMFIAFAIVTRSLELLKVQVGVRDRST